MVEGEQKLCLVEPTLELVEKMPLQIQMQLLEEMQVLEALEAEEDMEGLADTVIIQALQLDQEQVEAAVEREVMEAGAEQAEAEEMALLTTQGQEVQEVLAVLGEEAEAEDMLGLLQMVE